MSSITLKSSFFLPYHPNPPSSTSFSLPLSIRFPWKSNYKGCLGVIRAQSFDTSENNDQKNNKSSSPNAGDSKIPNGTMHKSRKGYPFGVCTKRAAGIYETIVKRAPQQVAKNLAQLMYSVMMTGYMFRNVQHRLDFDQSLEQVALPEPQEKKGVFGVYQGAVNMKSCTI